MDITMRLTQNSQKNLKRSFVVFLLATLLFFPCFTAPNSAKALEEPLKYAQDLSSAFEDVAKVITPSVVNIRAIKRVKSGRNMQQAQDPFFDLFRDFFGDDLFGQYQNPQDGLAQQGFGTGVIVDSNGHILTNHHVAGDMDEVTVKLSNGREYKAKIVGTDPRTDLAVIKVSAPDLAPAKLGNSDGLKIGEWVVAAGNPFGLDNTITAGIVSAKGRSIVGGGQYEDFIQTDAAINPGNSGGPLVNLRGEVVGINTAIFSRSGGYMGIGFAIPVNMAKNVFESLISKGKVVRGWLGVGIQNLTPELAESFNYPGTDGALIGHVEPDGPAEKAGLKQGDIIISINGERKKDINQLRNAIAAVEPNSKVELEVIRDGRKRSFKATVGELPTERASDQVSPKDSTLDFGISVENLTPDLAKRLGSTNKSGVVVTRVTPGSIAERAGLQPKDIIVSVNTQRLEDVAEFETAMENADMSKGVRLVVENRGMERFVILRSDE